MHTEKEKVNVRKNKLIKTTKYFSESKKSGKNAGKEFNKNKYI